MLSPFFAVPTTFRVENLAALLELPLQEEETEAQPVEKWEFCKTDPPTPE
jgi:hypothetical protein